MKNKESKNKESKNSWPWLSNNKDSLVMLLQCILIGILVWQTTVLRRQVKITSQQFERYKPKIVSNVSGYFVNFSPFIYESKSTGNVQPTPIFKNYLVKANEIKGKEENEFIAVPSLSSYEKSDQKTGERLEALWKKYFNYDDFKICIRINVTNVSLTTVSVNSFFPLLTPFEEKDFRALVWRLQKIYRIKGGDIEKEEELPLMLYSGESVIFDVVFYSKVFYSEFGEIEEDKALKIIEKIEAPFVKKLMKISGNFGCHKVYFKHRGGSLSSRFHPIIKELYKTFHNFKKRVKMLYFAYGSNMNEDELTQEDVGATILNAEKAILRDYKIDLTRYSKKRGGGVLDIISSKKGIVEGVLYRVPDEDMAKINKKEGVCGGAYEPIKINIEAMDGKIISNVTSYQVCGKEDPAPASEEYKGSALKGAGDHRLSESYITRLKSVLEKRKI